MGGGSPAGGGIDDLGSAEDQRVKRRLQQGQVQLGVDQLQRLQRVLVDRDGQRVAHGLGHEDGPLFFGGQLRPEGAADLVGVELQYVVGHRIEVPGRNIVALPGQEADLGPGDGQLGGSVKHLDLERWEKAQIGRFLEVCGG